MQEIPIIFSKFEQVCMHVSPCCFPNQQSECKMARVTREIAWVGVTAQLEQHGSHLLIAPSHPALHFAHWNYRCLHNNSFVKFLKIPFHGEKKVFQAFKQFLKCKIMWKGLTVKLCSQWLVQNWFGQQPLTGLLLEMVLAEVRTLESGHGIAPLLDEKSTMGLPPPWSPPWEWDHVDVVVNVDCPSPWWADVDDDVGVNISIDGIALLLDEMFSV